MTASKFLVMALLFLFNASLSAQKTFWNDKYVEPVFYYGTVLARDNAIGYLMQDHIRAFQLNVGIQTNGSGYWQRFLNYPRLGFGYYHGNLGNNEVFGRINSLFGTAAIKTLSQKHRINIEHNLSAGLSLMNTCYYLHKNPLDIAFGSRVNSFLQYAILMPVRVSKQVELYGGMCFTHTSAAKIVKPNQGLHMLLSRFGARVDLTPPVFKPEIAVPTFYDTVKHRFSVIFSTGIKQYNRYSDRKYLVYAITTEYCYKISHVFGFGAGLNFYYDNVIKPYFRDLYNEKAGFDKIFCSTAHATAELFIGQLSFMFQPGIYLYKRFDDQKKYPFKFGFRYHFCRHLTAGILLKAHWTARADFLEFGVGYTLYKP